MVVGPGSEFTIAARPALTFRSVVIPRQVSIECSVIIFCFHKELPVFVIALPLRAAKYVIIVQDAGRDAKTPLLGLALFSRATRTLPVDRTLGRHS